MHVARGHLVLEDGIGARQKLRFPRIHHGIRRLIVVGSDGEVSLAALRWLADQNAAFVMLDRDGSVLVATGPVSSSDARLRRAQSTAHYTGAALELARGLITQKLQAQEIVAREKLRNSSVGDSVSRFREELKSAKSINEIRILESRGAHAYWSAWKNLPIAFPQRDLHRTPDHWRNFRSRFSPLTRHTRLAADPVNAMLNYLYAVLESETRLAVAALGLDPGIGVLHVDSESRDSLACDVMEPVRPVIDAYLLNWISRETLRREWFFEAGNGMCRLMGSFAVELSKTAATWGAAVAPVAEWFSQKLWELTPKVSRPPRPATRLTQNHRRLGRGLPFGGEFSPPRPQRLCRNCGAGIGAGSSVCESCHHSRCREDLIQLAVKGRRAAHTPETELLRSKARKAHAAAIAKWDKSSLPGWLSKQFYIAKVQPQLRKIGPSVLASSLGISKVYAAEIRAGKRVPHPRHWLPLSTLVGEYQTNFQA